MKTIVAEIESELTPGTIIPHPRNRADFTFKGWGIRRGERALIYSIPNRNRPSKPYQKGITVSDWIQAFQHLADSGDFSRSWFKGSMPMCSKEGNCNFTTIGGVFELLGYATYIHGTYRAKKTISDECDK